MKYSIDTSAILDGYNRFYPPDVFPKLWNLLEGLISNGSLKATELVFEELARKDDNAKRWIEAQKNMFKAVDTDIQKNVTIIMSKYPRIVAEGGQKNMADPFVVAFAKQNNCIVVTGEKRSGSKNKPTIPFLCNEFDIKCMSILELIRNEKWLF